MLKLLALLFGALKFGKLLPAAATMLLSIAVYASVFGWWYAAGFVGLLLVHEMGHYVAARRRGLNVGLPTFIPFVGAWIQLKELPHDTETEAYVSAISGFEISVKHRKGKLELPLAPREWLAQAFAAYSLRELPITLEIAALCLVDFPNAPWELRMELARQCWDEARHVQLYYRRLKELGGWKGMYPIANLDWSMVLDAQGRVSGTIAVHDAIAKKRSGRRIPMHPELRRALDALAWIDEPIGPVIRSARGSHLRPNSIVNWFAVLFRDLGFEGCSSHSGRRSFITVAARNIYRSGCSLRDVQLLAGHRSIETTERYIDGDTCAQRKLVSFV